MSWQVFFTPHTDDETIGMAGAIIAAHDIGDEVACVLVTDNIPSRRGSRVFASVDHNIFQARRDEWKAAMATLDVCRLEEWDVSEAMLPMNLFEAHRKLYERMRDLCTELGDVRSLHTTWGFYDTHMMSGFGSISHGLCANALHRLTFERNVEAYLYGIYVYSQPLAERRAPVIRTLTERQHQLKCRAMDEYKQSDHSIGYGYTSVPELFTAAALDPREFVMDISSTNGLASHS